MSIKSVMQEFLDNSYLSGANAEYVEELYEQFLENPGQVSDEWKTIFTNLPKGQDISHRHIREAFKVLAKQPAVFSAPATSSNKQASVNALIDCFRRVGYRCARVNPLQDQPELDSRLTLQAHGLNDADLQETFLSNGLLPTATATLADIYAQLKKVYLSSVGYDVGHVLDAEEAAWLQQQIEQVIPHQEKDQAVQRQTMKKLVQADTLERYLDKRYVAQKRFSVEGTDALIPMIDRLITLAARQGTQEVILGMAHRGRVNVLINNMGLNPQTLYDDFAGPKEYGDTTGDLKYHRGFSSDVDVEGNPVHLSLLFNPSHLEFIPPVVLGSVRSRQVRHPGDATLDYALPILMHGDAAFSGEGVVMEAMNMSQLRAYTVGGAVQIVTNNQIGFTTCDKRDCRTAFACTDIAKLIDAPVFHVNADDLDAVQVVTDLAYAYRERFHKNVVIDLMGYRRQGHQEADEPSATAPVLYHKIRAHPRSVKIYGDELIAAGVVTPEQIAEWEAEQRRRLDLPEPTVDCLESGLTQKYAADWAKYVGQDWRQETQTAVDKEQLVTMGEALYQLPEGFELQKQVNLMVTARRKMASDEQPMDWGFGETLAYASLLAQGVSVRLVGQDSRRGTFSHRHSTLFDQKTGEEFVGLQQFVKDGARLSIYDSTLNEAGALAFEYGYSLADPSSLVIWEAQFGDFYNTAQVVVDQFISSGWQKWRRLSGLVMFLPHGCEGQGPEHTSARLERFLQLCAQQNIQVFVPSTPAQIFHLLRRQMLRDYRRPLIVMTPKSLLRNKLATSTLEDLSQGELQLLIPEQDEQDIQQVKRVVLCCGKVYFDLLAERRERGQTDVALVRVEQLYPFPYEELEAELKRYAHVQQVVWCQEEPLNQGAWFVTNHRLIKCLAPGQKLGYAGRQAFAAPASGFLGLHNMQQQKLVEDALDLEADLFAKFVSGNSD